MRIFRCSYCKNTVSELFLDKKYCKNCFETMYRECVTCHQPCKSPAEFALNSFRCNACQKSLRGNNLKK